MTTESETATGERRIIERLPDTPGNVMRAFMTKVEVAEVAEIDDGESAEWAD